MKSSYFVSFFCIIISTINLTACIPSKSELKDQTSNIAHVPNVETLNRKSSNTLINRKNDPLSPSVNTLPSNKISAPAKPSALLKDSSSASRLEDNDLSSIATKLQSSRLDTLPASMIICTVNGDPITINDYRHQFKTEQEQMQASLAMNQQVANKLLQMAQEKGVSLSAEERKHLMASANKMQAGGTKAFNKMLAENHMTKNQFQDQVFDVGLAFKMSGKLIEEGLLKELISRKLLAQAAKENGFSKEALNKYSEVTKSPQYKRLIEVSGMSVDDLHDEIVTSELCLKQIEKIKKDSPITDAEIANYYEKNKGQFRHGARIRLSQIFIARWRDFGDNQIATKMKIKKENPKLSDAELEKKLGDIEKEKAKLAQDLLQRARNGEDFANLANQYSEDLAKAKKKNGGDVGFQEEAKLDKFFADKVVKLPVDGIAPEVIVSPYGFHIFKVTGKESKGYYGLSEIKPTLKRLLAEEKGQEVVNNWLADARQKSNIVISPELKDLITANKLVKRVQ